MSARIAPAKRMKIEARRQAGERMKDIAAAEGVSERTVRRICQGIDAEYVIEKAPAAAFRQDEVSFLRGLTKLFVLRKCPSCEMPMVVARVCGNGRCSFCGEEWG
jgi:hypothetical protein